MKILFIIPFTVLAILTICDIFYLILLIRDYRRNNDRRKIKRDTKYNKC